MKTALRLSVPVIISILAFGASFAFAMSTDTVSPVVTLIDSAVMYITVGATFTDPGATATDNIDGDITSQIVVTGSVDTTTIGDYTLTYTVTNATGNVGTASRLVSVVTPTPPPSPSPVPSCTLSASPTSLAFGGGSSTLSWTTVGATDATTTIDNGVGVVSPVINDAGNALSVGSGSQTVSATTTTTYTLTIFSLSGETTCTAEVSVALPPPPPTPTTPTNKDQCKEGDWKTFTGPHFENQGQCVSYVQANEKADKKDVKGDRQIDYSTAYWRER